MEISSENDLFFLYVHEMNEVAFRELQESQRLTLNFEHYPQVDGLALGRAAALPGRASHLPTLPTAVQLLHRVINLCVEDPNGHTAILSLQRNFQARLDVIQNQDFKVRGVRSCIEEPRGEYGICSGNGAGRPLRIRASRDWPRSCSPPLQVVDLLSIRFCAAPEDLTKQHVTYR